MPESLVSTILQQFEPTIVDRLAGSLGENRDATQKAVSGGVPAMLAGLVGVAARPDGGGRLATAVAAPDPAILDNFSGMIGGSGQQALIDQGRSLASSLLGGRALDGMTGAIGQFAGLKAGSATGLIGLLAPVVLGTLGRQQQRLGLTSNGLAQLLVGEKDTIAAAMPQGLGRLLTGSGMLDGLSDKMRQGVGAVSGMAAGAAQAAQTKAADAVASGGKIAADLGQSAAGAARTAASAPGGIPRWLYAAVAAIVVIVVGYGVWNSSNAPPTAPAPRDTASTGSSGPPPIATGSVMVGQVDVGNQLKSALDVTAKTLGGVTDAASAQAAVPQLQDAASQLDQVSHLQSQIPADGRKSLAELIGGSDAGLRQLIDKTMAIPGVADVLKPAVDRIEDRLDAVRHSA